MSEGCDSPHRRVVSIRGVEHYPVTPRYGPKDPVVNERDGLGDDLVPDYLTSVRDGAFYGWPYSLFRPTRDPRQQGNRPDLVARAVAPDYAVGSHTASLGPDGNRFPEPWRTGAYIGQRGSWNRSLPAGYRVLFVPFEGGRRSGPPASGPRPMAPLVRNAAGCGATAARPTGDARNTVTRPAVERGPASSEESL